MGEVSCSKLLPLQYCYVLRTAARSPAQRHVTITTIDHQICVVYELYVYYGNPSQARYRVALLCGASDRSQIAPLHVPRATHVFGCEACSGCPKSAALSCLRLGSRVRLPRLLAVPSD